MNTFILGSPQYRVKANLVVVNLYGGSQKHISRGALVPSNALPEHIEHLLTAGLIEPLNAKVGA